MLSIGWDEILRGLARPLEAFTLPTEELYLGFWAPGLIFALYVYRRDRLWERNVSFIAHATSWKAIRSRSGQLDLRFFLVNTLFYFPIAGLVLSVVPLNASAQFVQRLLTELAGSMDNVLPAGPVGNWLLTISVFVAADFGVFIVHYAFHRVPFLWEFHRVHHSATSLHPLTTYRNHPLNSLVTLLVTVLLANIILGVVMFLMPDARPVEVLGTSVVALVLLAAGAMFRHSSVWFHFGPLNWILYSPAHHQIHHSAEVRHWGRNLGGLLSIWDRLFGTYYAPDRREVFDYGLGEPTASEEFDSVFSLYVTPFARIFRIRKSRELSIPPDSESR